MLLPYPSINESNKISQKSLTINALYSKYLLGCSTYNIQKDIAGNTYQEPHTQNMLFFFDEITVNNFRYAWSMFKYYQLQGADRYVFLFYPRRTGDVDFVKEHFIATLKSGETPIKDSEAAKIEIDFIDNRCVCTQEAGEFVVAINSKGENLRVDIEKSFSDDDGKLYVQPFPKELQDEIIRAFQKAANTIFYSLIEEQKQVSVNNAALPG